MADLTLNIIAVTPNDPLFRDLDSEIRDGITEIAKEEVNQLAILALKSFKSSVPIKTGELRGMIQIDYAKKNQKNPQAQVLIKDRPHLNSRGPNKPSSVTIADILNKKDFRRSRPSTGEPPFVGNKTGSTSGWIDEAYADFLKEANRRLSFSG